VVWGCRGSRGEALRVPLSVPGRTSVIVMLNVGGPMIAIVLMVCFAAWCFAQAVRLSGGGQRAKVCPEWDVCPERAVVREKVEIPEEASEPVARPVVMPAVVSPVPVRPAPRQECEPQRPDPDEAITAAAREGTDHRRPPTDFLGVAVGCRGGDSERGSGVTRRRCPFRPRTTGFSGGPDTYTAARTKAGLDPGWAPSSLAALTTAAPGRTPQRSRSTASADW
jgi:hypothetical protein